MELRTAALFLDMTLDALRSRLARGEIPNEVIRRIGKRIYVDREALVSWMRRPLPASRQ
jgi:hypothetical protein